MNAQNITLVELGAFSVSEDLGGIPWTFHGQQGLDRSTTLGRRRPDLSSARHTLDYNYSIADGVPDRFGAPHFRPGAAAFETNRQT